MPEMRSTVLDSELLVIFPLSVTEMLEVAPVGKRNTERARK